MNEETLFHQALSRPPAERAAFLDQACASQPELGAAVIALLAAHDEPGNFLGQPPAVLGATVDPAPGAWAASAPASSADDAEVGGRIGPYKLLQQLGEGGMGTVYVAEQEYPVKRRVALKVIKPGMGSGQILRRFEAERQALALMEHVNIARVLDAGTTQGGRPYFVMELVKGEPITKYCDGVHLPIRDRLALFTRVCAAIQHAHQKGIIHRDIKPGNVLVCLQDGQPVPKVIDFGVAKALHQKLTDQTLYTEIGSLVGTFEYMSPEQAELSALDIDTRADVYALGVLLYELLTGTTPLNTKRLRGAAYAEMLRMIKEEEPPWPSTRLTESKESLSGLAARRRTDAGRLTKAVRGELDWIVMKALEKDRTRRYEAARDLARDVERHLRDEPVEACPPSAAYRLKKFFRRHKGPVAAALLVVLALLGGLLGTGYGLLQAEQARDLAEANERTAMANAAQAAAERNKALAEKARAGHAADGARANQYLAHMHLAQIDYERLHFHRMRDTLDLYRQPPPGRKDVRGWEWYYLDRLCHAELRTLSGHGQAVTCAAVSPDGRRIVSGSADRTLKIWDASTGQEIRALKGHNNMVLSVAFSSDGKWVVSGGHDAAIKIWDAATGQEVRTLKGHSSWVLGVAFSADGERIVSGSMDQTVKVWAVATGAETRSVKLSGRPGELVYVAFSPDGKRFVTEHNDVGVQIWDAATARVILTFTRGEVGGSAAFSLDGKRVVIGSRDKIVKVWDATTGKETVTLKGHTETVTSVAFSPDGKRIASGSGDKTVKVWDAATGREIVTLKGHSAPVACVAFGPGGRRIVSGSADQTLKVWDPAVYEEARSLRGLHAVVTSVAFSPDGKGVAGGCHDSTVKVWDAGTGQVTLTLNGGNGVLGCVAFSPDGKHLVGGQDTTLRVWDAATGRDIRTLKGHRSYITSVAFSPDGKRLVSASTDHTLKVWETATGEEALTLKGHSNQVMSVAVSRDGRTIASGSCDTTVRLWDAATGQATRTLNGHSRDVSGVAFSPDGRRLVSGSWDGTLKVWDAVTGQEIRTLKGHTDLVNRVAFTSDGRRVVSGSNDGTVKVWDVATGQETMTLKEPHTRYITGLALSPYGKRIVCGGFDTIGAVTVWDARALTPELHAEREALGLVRSLFARPLSRAAVLATIRREETVTEEVRRRALALAQKWREDRLP